MKSWIIAWLVSGLISAIIPVISGRPFRIIIVTVILGPVGTIEFLYFIGIAMTRELLSLFRARRAQKKFMRAMAKAFEERELNVIKINGKQVDQSSLEVDGIDTKDYPDFCDAYFSAGLFMDGTEMSDLDLELLQEQESELLHEMVHDKLH